MAASEAGAAGGDAPWPEHNPYTTGTPTYADGSFVDRREALGRLHQAVADPGRTYVVVTGPRRIGKSSVLYRFVSELAGEVPSASGEAVRPAVAVVLDPRNLKLVTGDPPDRLARVVLGDLAGLLARQLGVADLPGWGDETGFRRAVLPALTRAAGGRRVVAVIDEMEFLEQRHEGAAPLIFGAFAAEGTARDWEGTAGPPLVVVSWGRPLGAVRTAREVGASLRYVKPIEIGCFDAPPPGTSPGPPEVLSALCALGGAYAWEPEAVDALRELTRGHPLYAGGINHVVFDRRRRAGDTSAVTAAEVEASVGGAIVEVGSSLEWAWEQISLVQSLLGRALAALTARGAEARRLHGDAAPDWGFTLAEVGERLRADGRAVELERLEEAVRGLIDNAIVLEVDRDSGRDRPGGPRYRISPFLTRWLCTRSYNELTRTQFDDHLQRAHQLLEVGARAAAMEELLEARRKIEVPLPQDDLATLAGLLRDHGREEEALEAYRQAWARGAALKDPGPYFDLLHRRLIRRLAAGEPGRLQDPTRPGSNPRDVWEEMRAADPGRVDDPEVAATVARPLLDRWAGHVARHETLEAQAVLVTLATLDPEGWRRLAADRYASALQALDVGRSGHDAGRRLATALAVVRDVLPRLTDRSTGLGVAALADVEALVERIRRKLGLNDAQAEAYREELMAGVVPHWWTETLAVLHAAWGKGRPEGLPRLPASLVATLLKRAPEACRRELAGLVARHAAATLEALLDEAPSEAVDLVETVVGALEASADRASALDLLLSALNDAVLSATDGDAPLVRRLVAHGATLYRRLLAASARAGHAPGAGDILELVEMLGHRVRRGPGLLCDAGEARQWRDLLSEPALGGAGARAAEAGVWSTLDLTAAAGPGADGEEAAWAPPPDTPLDRLFGALSITRGVEIPLDRTAAPVEYLRAFRGRASGAEVNVKVYSLPDARESGPDETEQLLLAMWAKERRLLDDLSSRRRARGLTAFRESRSVELPVEDASGETVTRRWLVVITEAAGPRNLRDEIDDRLRGLRRQGRQEVWSNLYWLIEAVHLLHRSGYLHRAIRPENVLISPGDEVSELRLANYEWSVYLQALDEWHARKRWNLDRYTAPEVLQHWKTSGESPFGESFAADVYALGLILFEVLVRPLGSELGEYHAPADYDHAEHLAWLARLRKEATARLDSADERLIVTRMLEGDPRDRATDLERAVEQAWRLALGGSLVQQQLENKDPRFRPTVVTLLWRGSENSVAVFLEQAGVDLKEVPEGIPALARFVAGELAGARVYRNGAPDEYPLLLEGRRVTFAVCPFREERTGQVFRRVPFCVVARLQDWKTGPVLARLPKEVNVCDLRDMRNSILDPSLDAGVTQNPAWEALFQLAARSEGGLMPAQREMLSLLELTAQVERKLWDEGVLPFHRVATGITDDGKKEWVWIEDRNWNSDRPGLVRFVSQQLARESREFELGTRPYATAPFNPGSLWVAGEINDAGRRVYLTRPLSKANDPPPTDGFLRPRTLEGNRALYHRRRRLLGRLEDDAYLLTAVTEPGKVLTATGHDPKAVVFKNEDLDADKKAVVNAVLCRRPIHVVQGPPGTGKTTLAGEVIRQVLERKRAERTEARILVTAQSHSPLNHLLEKVAGEIDEAEKKADEEGRRAAAREAGGGTRAQRKAAKEARGGQTVIVRLGSEERVLRGFARKEAAAAAAAAKAPAPARRGPAPPAPAKPAADPAAELVRQYIPEHVAVRHLENAAHWNPGSGGGVPPDLLAAWRDFLRGENDQDRDGLRADVERRLARTANLVFVTANDRQVADLGDDDYFDLLIYEEAAKAFPLEVLAPMSHARQWLLIGDHNQLPPYNYEEFRRELLASLSGPDGLLVVGDPQARARLQLSENAYALAERMSNFFGYLHETGLEKPPPLTFAFTLQTQWRMHPDIGTLIEEVYYKGKLRNGDPARLRTLRAHNLTAPTRVKGRPLGLNGRELAVNKNNLVWIDTPLAVTSESLGGERSFIGGGYRNPYEAQAIYAYLLDVRTRHSEGFPSVMLLSPYLAQVQLLNEFFRNWTAFAHPETGDLTEKAITVDSAQGRQAHVVFVSLVRNNNRGPEGKHDTEGNRSAYGFLTSEQRSAVMFSRAESLMVIVGCSRHFQKDPDLHIARVYDHVEAHGTVIDAKDVVLPYQIKILNDEDERRRRHVREDRDRARRQLPPEAR